MALSGHPTCHRRMFAVGGKADMARTCPNAANNDPKRTSNPPPNANGN